MPSLARPPQPSSGIWRPAALPGGRSWLWLACAAHPPPQAPPRPAAGAHAALRRLLGSAGSGEAAAWAADPADRREADLAGRRAADRAADPAGIHYAECPRPALLPSLLGRVRY